MWDLESHLNYLCLKWLFWSYLHAKTVVLMSSLFIFLINLEVFWFCCDTKQKIFFNIFQSQEPLSLPSLYDSCVICCFCHAWFSLSLYSCGGEHGLLPWSVCSGLLGLLFCHKREEIFLTLPFLHKNNKTRRQSRLPGKNSKHGKPFLKHEESPPLSPQIRCFWMAVPYGSFLGMMYRLRYFEGLLLDTGSVCGFGTQAHNWDTVWYTKT